MLRGSICLWGQAFYTQSCEGSLLNFGFAYNFMGVSVPTRLKMEISYRFIRTSKIREPSSSHLRTNQFLLESIYTQSCEEALQNLDFAYNFMGVSVPAQREMEISYRFIRTSRIRELSISHLRITSWASPSLRNLKWKYLTNLYADLQKSTAESRDNV